MKKSDVIRNYYYSDDREIGASHVVGKGKRPYYILCEINKGNYFAIVSTKTKHSGRKKTYQGDKKYIDNDIGSHLRLDLQIGFRIFNKKEIKNRKNDIKIGNLSEEKKKALMEYYSLAIKEQKSFFENS